MSKIKLELTPEQVMLIESGLHDQMRAAKERVRLNGLENGWELDEVMQEWAVIQARYSELQTILSAALTQCQKCGDELKWQFADEDDMSDWSQEPFCPSCNPELAIER